MCTLLKSGNQGNSSRLRKQLIPRAIPVHIRCWSSVGTTLNQRLMWTGTWRSISSRHSRSRRPCHQVSYTRVIIWQMRRLRRWWIVNCGSWCDWSLRGRRPGNTDVTPEWRRVRFIALHSGLDLAPETILPSGGNEARVRAHSPHADTGGWREAQEGHNSPGMELNVTDPCQQTSD